VRYLVRSDARHVFTVSHRGTHAHFFIRGDRTIVVGDGMLAAFASTFEGLVAARVLCPVA